MATYVDVCEVPSKGLFASVEDSAYICALGIGSYATSVVRGEFKCTFVVTAEDGCPFVHLVKLYHHLC